MDGQVIGNDEQRSGCTLPATSQLTDANPLAYHEASRLSVPEVITGINAEIRSRDFLNTALWPVKRDVSELPDSLTVVLYTFPIHMSTNIVGCD
jgi:hypothetical protein